MKLGQTLMPGGVYTPFHPLRTYSRTSLYPLTVNVCAYMSTDTQNRYWNTECIHKEMEKDACLQAQMVICFSECRHVRLCIYISTAPEAPTANKN